MNEFAEMFTGKARTEPQAEMRQWANSLFQMYTALAQEGFTEDQSLTLLMQFMRGLGDV